MHFVGLFLSSLLKMHGPKNKTVVICLFVYLFCKREARKKKNLYMNGMSGLCVHISSYLYTSIPINFIVN